MSITAQLPRQSADRQLAVWLFALAGFVMLMVLVGGLTRLTDSGLSITEWQPIGGVLPPLSQADWHIAFEKYKQIPEYRLVNAGMTLDAFKFIYWWEWGHRLLGRIVGLVFFMPFAIFMLQGKITRHRLPPLLGLFVLGGLQGFVGWYMVKSGLSDRVDVSQYRLAVHLGLALIIFAGSLWLALGYWRVARRVSGRHVAMAGIIVALVLAQSLLGALVAGIDAGKTYTDWPFMDGDIVPSGLFMQQPIMRNFFENHLTVQFDHRLVAYVLLGAIGWHIYRLHAANVHGAIRISALWLGAGVFAQVLLGIATLMLGAPLGAAIAHQLGAVIVLALAVTHFHFLRYRAPPAR